MTLGLLGRSFGKVAITWFIVAVVASFGLSVVELGVSLFLQLFLKNIGLLAAEVKTPDFFGSTLLTPGRLAVLLIVLAVARSAAQFFVNLSANISMETITARIRRVAVWETLLHPSRRFISSSSVNARIGDLANKAAVFAYSAVNMLTAAIQCLALAVILFITASGESIIGFFGLGVVGLLVLRLNRRTRRVVANVPTELRNVTEGIERVARNTTLVRVLRTERLEYRRLATSIDTYARHLIHAAYLGNFSAVVPPFAGILLILVIVVASQGWLHTPPLALLSFLYLFVRFVQVLSGAVVSFSSCNTNWPAFDDTLRYLESFEPRQIAEATQPPTEAPVLNLRSASSLDGSAPAIELSHVDFQYSETAGIVLRDITMTAAPGAQIAFVGPSGCGKSTLLGVVLGLLEPTNGTVLIGGRSPSEFLADAQTRVGYVGAESFLIAGTVRENLTYGLAHRSSDEDIWEALERAHLRTVVEGLEKRLDYVIAEDGSGLSAGQKQRLCLARALLTKPHLLVLDEASANLDVDTERQIAESIGALRGTTTTLLVSHRKDIYKYADRVVSLGPDDAGG